MKKININTIINKKFSTEISGYKPVEVDKFLDGLIAEINMLNDEAETLIEKVEEKDILLNEREEEIKKLKMEIENFKVQLKESSKTSNYEIMKELQEIQKKIK